MQCQLTIAADDLFLEVLAPKNQVLPEFTLYIEDIALGALQLSTVSFISKIKYIFTHPKISHLPFSIKELLPVFGSKTLRRKQFHFHINPKLKPYMHATNSLHILADDKKLVTNLNSISVSDSKFQLPLSQLKTNLESFLEFDGQRGLVPKDLSITSSGFSIKVKRTKKNILKFKFLGSTNGQSHLLHKNIEIFLDTMKMGVASVKHQENNCENLQFIFCLNAKLAEELLDFHYLRIKIFDEFYHIPDSFLNKKITPQNTKSKVKPRSKKLIEKGALLNKKGKLVKTKENDLNWLKDTLALYHHASNIFEKQFGYELYITGGTLLGYARTGGVIGFDKDFDSGYLSSFSNPEDIKLEFKKIILTLLKSGEDIRLITRVGKKFRCDYFMWFNKTGKHIDVFPAAFINGLYRRPTFVNTTLIKSDLYPLKQALFNGYEVKVPNNFEKKVAAVYGEAWQSPDPFWKKVKSPEVIEYRKSIMLTKADFLEIAEYSQHDGEFIRESIANDNFKIQF